MIENNDLILSAESVVQWIILYIQKGDETVQFEISP